MNDIGPKTQAALRRDPAGDALAGDLNLAEEVFTALRGRHRWLSTRMFVVCLVAFAGLGFVAMRFYDCADIALELRGGGLALSLMLVLVVTVLKIWFWLEMRTNPAAPLL